MIYKKEILVDNFPGVYAVGSIMINHRLHYVAASENREGKMYLVDSHSGQPFELKGGAGGVMGILAAPEKERMIGIEGFYPVFDSDKAKLVTFDVEKGDENEYQIGKRLMEIKMPYIHRIGFLREPDGIYVAAGNLCGKKSFTEDWSSPGMMKIGKYTMGIVKSFEVIQDGIYKHHAMYIKENENGFDDLYYGGSDGVFQTIRRNERWISRKLIDIPVSDIVSEDIDGDGKNELVVIEEFHGDRTVIFKDCGNGFERRMEIPMNFGHVLWYGKILGKPALLLGNRGGGQRLVLYRFSSDEKGKIYMKEETVIDEGQAPAQITVINSMEESDIIAANHGVGQLVRYRLTK